MSLHSGNKYIEVDKILKNKNVKWNGVDIRLT
jgi:hypothetical protein